MASTGSVKAVNGQVTNASRFRPELIQDPGSIPGVSTMLMAPQSWVSQVKIYLSKLGVSKRSIGCEAVLRGSTPASPQDKVPTKSMIFGEISRICSG